ncbi:hypothetical protein [Chitinimonas sp.]|uniref:hypothetical protein n=1 Tax=Chitinimonas sp. TaxID=1934313 RepID=UPI0035B0A521
MVDTRTLIAPAALALLCSFALPAQASDEPRPWSFNAGFRVWHNEWDANSFPFSSNLPPGNNQTTQRTVSHVRDSKTMIIPMVSARYGDWALTATSTMPRSFNLADGITSINVPRSESDVSLSYYITPQISVGIGQKHISWTNIRIRGPVASLGLAAPLQQGLTLYSGLGLGRLRSKNTVENSELSISYFVGEAGLAYSLGALDSRLSNFTALLAYRNQRVTAHDVGLSDSLGRIYTQSDVSDVTSGPVLGLTARF